jgi:hypothetical protein
VHGTGNFFFKHDALSTKPDGSEKFPFDQEQFGATIGGPLKRDRLFYFVAYDEQQFGQTKQLDPTPYRAARRGLPRAVRQPQRELLPIDRTNDARVFLGKADYQLNSANLLSPNTTTRGAGRRDGTFDVNSWGNERQRRRA